MTRARAAAVVACAALMIAALAIAWLLSRRSPAPDGAARAGLSVAEALGGVDTTGFARVMAARPFRFPEDHGPHPEYRTEWWYFTGNVESADGRRFGYQLTLFRNAIAPAPPAIASDWSTNQIWMGHLGITDAAAGSFHGFERFARGAAGLAGAHAAPLRVWLEDWSIEGGDGAGEAGVFPVRIRAASGNTGIDLRVSPAKPLVLQGDAGYSRKGADPGNASHYYSFTRLRTSGSIVVAGAAHQVAGTSWLDREWSTSALDADQVGWDWFALQFDDRTELMYYQLRNTDGGADVNSRGTFVRADGTTRDVPREDVRLDVLRTWPSPRGGTYPAAWRLRVAALELDVEIVPLLDDQEHDTYVRYWEGAVDVRGTRGGAPVNGVGYAELTGYAADALRR